MGATIGTRLFTLFFGRKVGTDSFGNRYYRRRRGGGLREQRWVIYRGEPEATKVPAGWHGWLHHSEDTPPKPGDAPPKAWQKGHLPNLTGTDYAYRPPGHSLRDGEAPHGTVDYQAWRPEKE